MNPLISVIVPVYNAEDTIKKCIDCLLSSSGINSEIILINDGSLDKSAEICSRYAREYKYIHYYEKTNGGVSSARNMGLDKASGKYITFVDSDDYVTHDYFQIIEDYIKNYQCDFIQFSYTIIKKRGTKTKVLKSALYDTREELLPEIINAICNKRINHPWANVYLSDIIKNHQIRFPVSASIAEDRVFNIKYSFYINSYYVSDQQVYYVNTCNDNSLSRKQQDNFKQQIQNTTNYFNDALNEAPITNYEKELYIKAMNFGSYRSVYHDAKLLHKKNISWLQRQKCIWELCNKTNAKRMKYPKTLFCTLITIPIRMKLTVVIDLLAWKLVH